MKINSLTNNYPAWKSVLWFLGIVLYSGAATVLSLFWVFFFPYGMRRFFGPFLGSSFWEAPFFGAWVLLLVIPGWQLTKRGHKLEGSTFILLAIAAMLMSALFLWKHFYSGYGELSY